MINITTKQDALTRIDVHETQQTILFLSDVHFDSPFCDLKLLKKHLDQAAESNALILIAGDLYDGMQGQNDPRRSYKELKAVYKGIDYFDRVLDDSIEFFRPYKDNLALLGYGNHEYSIVRHNGTDLVQRFVGIMRGLGSPVVTGGYGGFVRLSMYKDYMTTPRDTIRIWYNHGSGSEAATTKGLPQAYKQAAYVSGVNVIWNAHNHQDYVSHQSTLEVTNKDVVRQGLITFIRTPGYKNEYGDAHHGYNGYAVSKMMTPTPRGCCWGKLEIQNRTISELYYADVI